jgi:AcrR family transcriptional regulator
MVPARRPPQQARSRVSEQKLVDAARSLLAERSWEEAAVADIAARAGLTVGAFYARFPSKEALFRHLESLAFDQSRLKVARIIELADRGASPLELLRELVRSNVRIYRENAALVRALVVRSHVDAELRERLRELSRENFAIVGRALVRAGTVDHEDVRSALEFALYAERSVLREAVLFGEGWSKERQWSDERIVEETVRLIARYLGLDQDRATLRPEPKNP